jgi:CRP/FNR family transcriptional regulator
MILQQEADNCVNCQIKSSIFNNLTNDELARISENRYTAQYKSGEIIFKQGTPSPYFVCITRGLAKLYIEGYGKNLILALVNPVDYIFDPGVYVDNKHYYSALFRLSRGRFFSLSDRRHYL